MFKTFSSIIAGLSLLISSVAYAAGPNGGTDEFPTCPLNFDVAAPSCPGSDAFLAPDFSFATDNETFTFIDFGSLTESRVEFEFTCSGNEGRADLVTFGDEKVLLLVRVNGEIVFGSFGNPGEGRLRTFVNRHADVDDPTDPAMAQIAVAKLLQFLKEEVPTNGMEPRCGVCCELGYAVLGSALGGAVVACCTATGGVGCALCGSTAGSGAYDAFKCAFSGNECCEN